MWHPFICLFGIVSVDIFQAVWVFSSRTTGLSPSFPWLTLMLTQAPPVRSLKNTLSFGIPICPALSQALPTTPPRLLPVTMLKPRQALLWETPLGSCFPVLYVVMTKHRLLPPWLLLRNSLGCLPGRSTHYCYNPFDCG